MINLSLTYRTASGLLVRALTYHYTPEVVLINGEGKKTGKNIRVIAGQIKVNNDWILACWDELGRSIKGMEHFDLVEYKEEKPKQPKLFAGL